LTLKAPRTLADPRALLRRHQHGRFDPTISLSATEFWRAARTPDGPGTLHLTWANGDTSATAYGAGASWLLDTVPTLIGETDAPTDITPHHRAVATAVRKHGMPLMSASGLVLSDLIRSILGQRVTSLEAVRQWSALCRHTLEPAPGPIDLRLPPNPLVLATTPNWQYHRMGIERQRADTIAEVCRHARRVNEVADMSIADGYERLMALPGVGVWTAACTMWTAMGDPDAVPVGDFHVKNVVSFALAGEPRGTDERMLELLAPYAGHRGRVLELLSSDGWQAPKYGPKQPIRSIARW
jgi:endonuclease III